MLQAVVTYVIVKGMVELGNKYRTKLEEQGAVLRLAAYGSGQRLRYQMLTYLLASLLVSIITIIVSVIEVVWYLVKFTSA